MNEQEQFLTEALKSTSTLVDVLEERYREAAFPVILQALIQGNHAKASAANTQEVPRLRTLTNLTVVEFFQQAAPDTHVARFVCAAHYLLHVRGVEGFVIADILAIYGKLRVPKPKNPSDVLGQCIRKGYITDGPGSADKQKSWVITLTGERFVEELLNGNTGRGNAVSR